MNRLFLVNQIFACHSLCLNLFNLYATYIYFNVGLPVLTNVRQHNFMTQNSFREWG